MHCKGGNFSKSRKNKVFCSERVENLSKMHCKGRNFTDFLLRRKGAILKVDFFAAHTVSRQTQCPGPRIQWYLWKGMLDCFPFVSKLLCISVQYYLLHFSLLCIVWSLLSNTLKIKKNSLGLKNEEGYFTILTKPRRFEMDIETGVPGSFNTRSCQLRISCNCGNTSIAV